MEINTQLCPDCDCPLDHLHTFGDGPQAFRICPVCNPEQDPFSDEGTRAQDMAQAMNEEMERDND
jgi:hypothetical protein